MKKIFLSALLAIAVAVSSFAAAGNKVSYAVRSNFEAQFRNVSDVQWSFGDDQTKASFLLDNVRTEALFDNDGELMGTSRGITLDELPVRAKRAFAKKFNGYTVKEAIRFEGKDGTTYYISAEHNKGLAILKVDDSGFVLPVRK